MIFDEFDFSTAIIGKDFFGRAVFSFEKMIRIMVYSYGYDRAEATEYLEYKLDCELQERGDSPVILYNI